MDINCFFHLKLKLDKIKALEFDNLYNEYEIIIYKHFTNHQDGYYYLDTNAEEKEIKNIYFCHLNY